MVKGDSLDWRSLSLAIGGTVGALLTFLVAAALTIYGIVGTTNFTPDAGSTGIRQFVLFASALMLIGALLATASYYGLRSLMNRPVPAVASKEMRAWELPSLLCLCLISAWLAQVLQQQDPWAWLTPVLYLLAIGVPAYLLTRIASAGLFGGSPKRVWGILATSIVVGIGLASLIEMALILLGLIAVALYLGLHPGQLAAVREFATQLAGASGRGDALNALRSRLDQPAIFVLALAVASALVPLIEEAAKSVAVWAVFDHLDTPAQGFVAGAVSGAGFGLVESLLAAVNPDSSWAVTLLARGGSTMMHVIAAAVAGWGIASFRAHHRPVRVLGAYAGAIGLHGLWNGAVVLLAFGGLRTTFDVGSTDALGKALVAFGGALLLLMYLCIPLAVGAVNSRFRSAAHSILVNDRVRGALAGSIGKETKTGTPSR